MNSLVDKVAIVTGGASGIGAGIVRSFLQEGAKVTLLDINDSLANNLTEEMAGKHGTDKIQFIKCDVSKEDQLLSAFRRVTDRFGTIDIIVNNAGIADESFAMYKNQIELNFTAVVTSTLRALEHMRQDNGGKGGTIINVSSVCGLMRISPGLFVYGAIKSGLIHFGSCLGMKEYYSRTHVRVITICFGLTQTNIIQSSISFDEQINRESEAIMRDLLQKTPVQSTEAAANGVIECFRKGESGSTWLVNNGVISDITENIVEAYEIMSEKVRVQ